MTERDNMMRVSLYGCSHKPKVSAMVSPKIGDEYFCPTCRRKRHVVSVLTNWSNAVIQCQGCPWEFPNKGKYGRKVFVSVAVRHANTRNHRVHVVHDNTVDEIRPKVDGQIPLIDDLLLP